MARWIRFERAGEIDFGTLDGEQIAVHEGDMFEGAAATSERLALDEVTLLTPTEPSKMIALWNNFHAMSEKFELGTPEEPLYFIKGRNCYHPGGAPIRRPGWYEGRVVFEGELGIVIGREVSQADEETARQAIFGYTCVNDVTAFDLIDKDGSFAQWTRSKSFDTFGVFGPVVATGLDPAELVVRTLRDGEERQNYPISDMIFAPARLVSMLSRDMTLVPGDVIACGTSLGAGTLKPGSTIEVIIDGIGSLGNRLD